MADTEVTLFDKIVAKQIPASVVYEDDKCLAFKDINPQAPIHYVLIPKNRDGLSQLSKVSKIKNNLQQAEDRHVNLLGHLMVAVSKIAAATPQLKDGYRIVINDGANAGQTVFHLHIHIFGGAQLSWPPGTPGPGGEGLPKY